MPHSFFPHTGDIGIRLQGATLGDLFAAASDALLDVVTDPDTVRTAAETALTCTAAEPDLLLHEFMSEILFRLDARRELSRAVSVAVVHEGDVWRADARLAGERFDPERHPLRVAVKAVTYHALTVVDGPDGWTATVILDI